MALKPDPSIPTLFRLHRLEDESGVSGTGIVAYGVVFGNGKVVLAWGGAASVPSVAVFDSIQHVETIHGHGGKTRIEWLRMSLEGVEW